MKPNTITEIFICSASAISFCPSGACQIKSVGIQIGGEPELVVGGSPDHFRYLKGYNIGDHVSI